MSDGFDGMDVTVMGLGRFGGGLAVARWLLKAGARVTVTDRATATSLEGPLAELKSCDHESRLTIRVGGHDEADFTRADLVVANPAVLRPWENQFLCAAEQAGVPLTTEIRLVTDRLDRSRVVGVTGTAGKSTTAAMIHHALNACGVRAVLGGNIGGSLLPELDALGDSTWVVLELSSAQLYWLGEGVGHSKTPGWSPGIAVTTNLSPNHLDWHETFDHYRESKRNITRYQHGGSDQRFGYPETVDVTPMQLSVPGDHNQRNASLARLATSCVLSKKADFQDEGVTRLVEGAIQSFQGLPHRLELIARRDGVEFYNDSKSTTPDATCLAISAFPDSQRVHLIAGGSDKGVDLSSIAANAPRLAGLYTIGRMGRTIAAGAPASSFVCSCDTLDRAMDSARARARPGDVVLLSPGCASFDQFDNYAARGEAFRRLVNAIPSVASPVS